MMLDERLHSILQYMEKHRAATLKQLAELNGVSLDTVRRDLVRLEDDGKLSDREAMCDSLCFELLYGAGFRVSELCSLKWGNIDFTNGVARITGKGSKVRFCPFGEQALALLKLWRQGSEPDSNGGLLRTSLPRIMRPVWQSFRRK